MQQVAITTDSTACLPRDLVDKYGIVIMPIRLLVQGKIYRDSIDITPSEAYQFLEKDPEKFSTSPSSPVHFLDAFREASLKARNILCITLSTGLSTGYNVALLAKEQAETELPGVKIEVMDSRNVTSSEGFVVLAAARAAADGQNLAQAIKAAEVVRDKVTFLFCLDTMKYVYRTGRVPKVASQVGSMLNIRPILTMSGGLVHMKGVVRSKRQGLNRILQEMRGRVGRRPVRVAVMHADVPDEAEALKRRMASEFNCIELWVAEFSPVMGYATGKGTLGFAFYTED